MERRRPGTVACVTDIDCETPWCSLSAPQKISHEVFCSPEQFHEGVIKHLGWTISLTDWQLDQFEVT